MEDNDTITEDCSACGGIGALLGGSPPYTWLNKRPDGPRGGVGHEIAELIIYTVQLSVADRNTMITYLNDKYTVY